MKNGILISLFLFLFVQVSYSQVKIKEKVEIEPHIRVNKISSGSEATYTYILSWPESSQP